MFPVEYRLRWVPDAIFFVLGIYISCCLCQFLLRQAPNANPFFREIWALRFLMLQKLRIIALVAELQLTVYNYVSTFKTSKLIV